MIEITAATDADLAAIATIERESFPVASSMAALAAELGRDWARIDVARSGGDIVAYCNYWLITAELHIHTIATRPERRQQGIASALLSHVLATARRLACELAILEVRSSNASAIRLYQRAGFSVEYVRPRYYRDNDEDALVMSYRL